jgi:hypothetical protein
MTLVLMCLLSTPVELMIGWEGRSPLPSPHTTVRTGPYTAVHVDRSMARS